MAACCTSMWGNPILYSYTVYSTYRNLISQMRRYEGQGVSLTTEKECSCLFVLPSSFVRVGNSLIGFSSESLVFCEQKSERVIHFKKRENRSQSLFCKEGGEQFALGRSFLKSNESKSLPSLFKKEWLSTEWWEGLALGHKKAGKLGKTVKDIIKTCFWEHIALKKRVIWLNHSQSLFGKERREQYAHGHSFLKSDASKSLRVSL